MHYSQSVIAWTLVYGTVSGLLSSAVEDSSRLAERQAVAKAILDTWRQRQETTRELTFTWTSEDYHLYSPADMYRGLMRSGKGEDRKPIPESRVTSTSGGRIWYGPGDHVRFDLSRTPENGGNFEEVHSEGKLTLLFRETKAGYPSASIMVDTVPSGHNTTHAKPMRLLFRPFLKASGFEGIEKAQCVGTGFSFEGRRCDILNLGRGEVWVSADEHRLPLRIVGAKLGGTGKHTEFVIRYDPQVRELPVPVGWTITHFGIDGETVVQSHDVTLTEYDFVNPPSPETFKIEFPHGTWVSNRATREDYIVREGKPNRIIRPGEFTADYDDLLNSDMPITPQEIATKSTVNWIWVGNGLIIAFIVFLLYRRHVQT